MSGTHNRQNPLEFRCKSYLLSNLHEKQPAEECIANTFKALYKSYSHYAAEKFWAGPIKSLAEELLTTVYEI
jgi:carbonic anhydrase